MNRRTALRNVVIVAAGAGLLPSCMQESKSVIPLKNISVTGAQERMLAALTEAIIPSTKNFVGAKELRSHEFVLTMIDDCTSVEDQGKFTEGLKAFDKLSHDKFGQIFPAYTAEQRNSLLADIEKKNGMPEDVLIFYGMVKRYTVQSFTSSKEYMTDIRKYKIVPGAGFKGCVPVNKT
jgi:hypothetical protein